MRKAQGVHQPGGDSGFIISTTMVKLATRRLARWRGRATVLALDGTETLLCADASFHGYMATYVLDLLPESRVAKVVREAPRVLVENGKLCIITSKQGRKRISRSISCLWRKLYATNPSLVGGCRPLQARSWLDGRAWEIEHLGLVSAWQSARRSSLRGRNDGERQHPEMLKTVNATITYGPVCFGYHERALAVPEQL